MCFLVNYNEFFWIFVEIEFGFIIESKSTKFKSKIDLDRYQKILKESDANKWEKEASSVVESLSKIMQGFTEEPNRDKEDMQLIDVTDDDQMNHDDVRKDDQTVNSNKQ